ncbi:MAG: type II toxin-antitoxin system HigB family toxin [Thermodesulfobacteriota bacterium]|jgi:mRNA interferase HigB
MHVISRRALLEFARKHPDAAAPLRTWYRLMARTSFQTLDELRRTFPSADLVGGLVVFNVGGNKYRLILIASLHFNRQKVYIRHVLTHAEYDRGRWKP